MPKTPKKSEKKRGEPDYSWVEELNRDQLAELANKLIKGKGEYTEEVVRKVIKRVCKKNKKLGQNLKEKYKSELEDLGSESSESLVESLENIEESTSKQKIRIVEPSNPSELVERPAAREFRQENSEDSESETDLQENIAELIKFEASDPEDSDIEDYKSPQEFTFKIVLF